MGDLTLIAELLLEEVHEEIVSGSSLHRDRLTPPRGAEQGIQTGSLVCLAEESADIREGKKKSASLRGNSRSFPVRDIFACV
jgi:hypothetical protein